MSVSKALLFLATSFATVLLGAPPLSALPEKGTPAPPLDSLQLLQASADARAGRASLKGKVVVLEFWATWCAPCVAGLPHLNQLVESLDPAKFQFISIDDEAPKLVQEFLAKKKMSGWVGVDTSGGVFAWYGVKSRPTTIIIDGNGKIVAATEPDSLNASDLQAVAEGKSITFKSAMEVDSTSGASAPDTTIRPLFAVSFSKTIPDAKFSMVKHPPTGIDVLGADADYLMTTAYNPMADRLVLMCPLPEGRYDLRTDFTDVPDSVISSVIQAAVSSGLHLQVKPKTVTKNAYILKAMDASKKLLNPTASTGMHMRGYWNGNLRMTNGTMNDLAYELATALETPVVNETGIDGIFDVQLKFTDGNADSVKATLKNVLGLELVQGNQEMSIAVLEVSKQEKSKTITQATKP